MANIEYLPLPTDDCPCTLRTCPSVIADLKLARLPPRYAVIEAGKESPTAVFVLKVANATMMDSRYRRSGAATMFIRHILQGKSADGKAPWEYSIMGLINVFASIAQANSQVQDAAILREMYEAYPRIIETIWKDFNFLTGTGRMVDNRRAVTSKLIGFYAQDLQMKRTMYDEKTLKILLHCWLEIPPDDPTRENAMVPVEQMFHPVGSQIGAAPPEDYMMTAFKSFKISTFVSKVNFAMKNKKLLGTRLDQEINLISLFMRTKEPVFSHLIENKVPKQVALALRRQLKHQESEGIETIDGVFQEGGLFMQLVLTHADDTMATFTDLLANTCFAEVGVAAFKISSKTGSDNAEAWYEIFEKIKHSMTCRNQAGCEYHATPAFIEAARTSLERIAIQTLISLEEEVKTSRKYLNLWQQLLVLLGITPQSIRERYRLDKKCCNLNCPARKSGIRQEKKHTCSQCRAVWYCDAICQKSDWKTHKTECKKLAEDLENI